MGSRPWSPQMLPPCSTFYREAYNMFWSLNECNLYVDSQSPAGSDACEHEVRQQPVDGVGDWCADWVLEQKEQLDPLKREARGDAVLLSFGLPVDIRPGETAKVLVPTGRRRALIEREHASLQHQGWMKVLQRSYTVVRECNDCALIYGKHTASSALSLTPVLAWPLRSISMRPPCRRTALLMFVVIRRGIFLVLLCDETREYMGKFVSGLCAVMGANRLSTKAYIPRANAMFERVREFLGRCLRMSAPSGRITCRSLNSRITALFRNLLAARRSSLTMAPRLVL